MYYVYLIKLGGVFVVPQAVRPLHRTYIDICIYSVNMSVCAYALVWISTLLLLIYS